MERWRPVRGFLGYFVSEFGRVQGRRGKVMSPGDVGGYRQVTLRCNNHRHLRFVHRLVLTAFDRSPRANEEANHEDGNKSNNCLTNLEWVTHRKNALHRARVLRKGVGSDHYRAKLSVQDVHWIRSVAGKVPNIEIAEQLGISPTQACAIAKRRSWKWLS